MRLLLVCLLALAPATALAGDWTQESSEKGRAYAYELSSQQGEQGLVRYRVLGSVDATPDALVRAVRVIAADPSRAPEGQIRRLISQSADEFVVHTRIDLPLPFGDRDIVTRGVGSADADGTRRIHWKAIADVAAPPSDRVIRIQRAEGVWVFTPEQGRTRVSYETYMDLGGSLPDWLIQGILGGTVGETFENVAREALGS